MEDLDLDELDQAVNKMMAKPSRKKPATKISQPEQSEPAFHAEEEAPKFEFAPEPDKEETSTEAAERQAPKITARRRVHPGAMDIMPAQKTQAPSARPAREAASIQPPARKEDPEAPKKKASSQPRFVNDVFLPSRQKNEQPEAAKPEPTLSAPEEEPQPAPKPEKPEVKKPEGVNNWPDPLDYLDYDKAKPKDKEGLPEEEPEQQEPQKQLPPEPTPFVTTKVEKRPLGAYTQPTPEEEPEKLEESEPPIAPPEADKKEMAAASLQSQQHLEVPIPQQYRTEDREPGDEVRSVYDTKEYHAPPQPMYGSRKSGPWFVIGIVALITLLVVVVLVGYFMMTGTFDLTRIW